MTRPGLGAMCHLRRRGMWGAVGGALAVALASGFALLGGEAVPQGIRRVGAGGYALRAPGGAPRPSPPVRLGADLAAPVPTNRFWSSLVTGDQPLPQYPHPLAVQPAPEGVRIGYPGAALTTTPQGIFASMASLGHDLVLTTGGGALPRITLEGHGDWSVRVRLASDAARLDATYAHGSPYVYATVGRSQSGGAGAQVRFAAPPELWSGGPETATLGVTVRGRAYGLFGPRGSTWSGLEGGTWTNHPGDAHHVSIAALPAATPEALALLERHAHAHVVDTRVAWRYDPATSVVSTSFRLETRVHEGEERAALFALYPHQWAHTDAHLVPGWTYASVRGPMRLARGAGFDTAHTYPGLLPALPPIGGVVDPARRRALLEDEVARAGGPPLDAYWEGKLLGRIATQVALCTEEEELLRRRLLDALKGRLERRFTAALAPPEQGEDGEERGEGEEREASFGFDYDSAWGTLIARPDAYGSATSLNDHHFHYGYWLRAVAEIARHDPDWARPERFGAMARLLVRDVASPDRDDPLFPFLRCFDPYAGHSWASGDARSPDGNNQESSSEAMNAWSALVLLGAALGDRELRDLGIYLYTTELAGIEDYWFDVHGRTFPRDWPHPSVSLVWGGKSVRETWFSTEPEALFGINWLPFHGGSLYLGRHPEFAARNYAALREARGSDGWRLWPDLVLMYRALSDPADARRQLDALGPDALPEAGNSRLNLEHWVGAFEVLGGVDRAVTADCALHAVFRKGDTRTYVAYRMPGEAPFVARFSDGVEVRCEDPGFTLARRRIGEGTAPR